MNILVTGAGGLIGSEAVRYYGGQGHRVFGVENNMRRFFFGPPGDVSSTIAHLKESVPSFRHVELDIRDRAGLAAMFEQTRFDLIIHCAAQPSHDKAKEIPLIDFEVNALGTVNLLELTRQSCAEAVFIYMSTNKVYGDAPNELKLVELPTRWDYARPENYGGISEGCRIDQTTHSLFGASKTAGDVMAQEYGRYFGMKVGIFRAGCMTGPQHAGVELHGFLSYLIKAAVQGKPYTIFGYKGKQVRDNIHSLDVVRAVDSFAQNPHPGEVYNLGGGRRNSLSVLEAIDAIEQATGLRIAHAYDPRNRVGDHICYISDLTKLRGHFPDWDITIGLGDLIAEMVRAQFERNPEARKAAVRV